MRQRSSKKSHAGDEKSVSFPWTFNNINKRQRGYDKDKRESKCKLKLIGCSFIISREIHPEMNAKRTEITFL